MLNDSDEIDESLASVYSGVSQIGESETSDISEPPLSALDRNELHEIRGVIPMTISKPTTRNRDIYLFEPESDFFM